MNEQTLNELIQRGVAIYEQRIADEQARMLEMQEMRARERADSARAILDLLPPPLADFAEIDVFSEHAYVRISRPFPRAGSVKIYAQRDRSGQWSLCGFEATDPDGYYLRLPSLEVAAAYAAGVLKI